MTLDVEEIDVVNDLAFEQARELFGVDTVKGFDLAVQSGHGRSDVDVADAMSRVCTGHTQPDGVVDRRVLAVARLEAGLPERLDELQFDLKRAAGALFLVALPLGLSMYPDCEVSGRVMCQDVLPIRTTQAPTETPQLCEIEQR